MSTRKSNILDLQQNEQKEVLFVTITERIFVELSQRNITQKDFANNIDVNEKTVSAWKKNNSLPPADKLSNISDCLGVSLDFLLTGEEKKPSLSEDKVRLLEMYDMLTDMEKGEILGELKQMTKKINIHTAEIAARSTNNEPPKVVIGDFSDILNAPDSTDDYK